MKERHMRVLHIQNLAGVATVLSRAQRKYGNKSDVIVLDHHPFGFEEDFVYPSSRLRGVRYLNDLLTKWGPDYDVFHFHDGPVRTFRFFLDYGILKHLFHKKTVYLYHGGSLRKAHRREPYERFNRKLTKIYVSMPDLIQYTKARAEWIPNPVDLSVWQPVEKEPSETVRILHYPTTTREYYQGKTSVEVALDRLKSEGYAIEKLLVTDVPHRDMPRLIASSDIVVDKVARAIGWYGILAVEALAMRKPVLAYIDPRLEDYMPFDPFIRTTPETVYNDLKALIEDEQLRRKYGDKGRAYAEMVHDSQKVALRWIEIYEETD